MPAVGTIVNYTVTSQDVTTVQAESIRGRFPVAGDVLPANVTADHGTKSNVQPPRRCVVIGMTGGMSGSFAVILAP